MTSLNTPTIPEESLTQTPSYGDDITTLINTLLSLSEGDASIYAHKALNSGKNIPSDIRLQLIGKLSSGCLQSALMYSSSNFNLDERLLIISKLEFDLLFEVILALDNNINLSLEEKSKMKSEFISKTDAQFAYRGLRRISNFTEEERLELIGKLDPVRAKNGLLDFSNLTKAERDALETRVKNG